MRDLLEKLARGEISVTEAEKLIKLTAIQEIEHLAKIDNGRELRKGIPEIILADGKSPPAIRDIILKILAEAERVIVSRVSPDHVAAIKQAVPPEASDPRSLAELCLAQVASRPRCCARLGFTQ